VWLCVDRRVLQVAAVEARGVTASTVASSTATDSPGAAPESDETGAIQHGKCESLEEFQLKYCSVCSKRRETKRDIAEC